MKVRVITEPEVRELIEQQAQDKPRPEWTGKDEPLSPATKALDASARAKIADDIEAGHYFGGAGVDWRLDYNPESAVRFPEQFKNRVAGVVAALKE